MTAAAYIKNDAFTGPQNSLAYLGVVTQQPLGISNLVPGQLDIMLDRRLNQDDNRGLAQSIKDNVFTVLNFKISMQSSELENDEIYQSQLFMQSTQILRPITKLFTSEITSSSHQVAPKSALKSTEITKKLNQCQLDLSLVLLPTEFQDYQSSKDKIILMLKSYRTRSSCEKKSCAYENVSFKDIFETNLNLETKYVDFSGNSVQQTSDTKPIQAFEVKINDRVL